MRQGKLNIVSIVPYKIFPAQLGGEKGIAVFNDYLAGKVHLTAVTVTANKPSYAKEYLLLNVLSNTKLRYVDAFLFFRMRRILQRAQATHLLIEHPYFGWLAWLLKKTSNIKLVVHSHNIEYMRSRSIGRWWWKALMMYEGWVYRQADRVFFISEDDRSIAYSELRVPYEKSQEVTYGIEQSGRPTDLIQAREEVCFEHGIDEEEKLLLFNGALYHSTNYEALQVILDQINPILLHRNDFKYKIIVCGKGLPESFRSLDHYRSKNIIYAGFVDDISKYFKAADIFINPILTGGGVKTKAIEALAMDCTVVSTSLGAMGINRSVCKDMLQVVESNDWTEFSNCIISAANKDAHISEDFFAYYYWGNIIDRAIQGLVKYA